MPTYRRATFNPETTQYNAFVNDATQYKHFGASMDLHNSFTLVRKALNSCRVLGCYLHKVTTNWYASTPFLPLWFL
jgi:hypothetical protein